MKIIKFEDRNNLPDSNCVCTDSAGTKWYLFSATYYTKNFGDWGIPEFLLSNPDINFGDINPETKPISFHFWAKSESDAIEKIKEIKETVCLDGMVYRSI